MESLNGLLYLFIWTVNKVGIHLCPFYLLGIAFSYLSNVPYWLYCILKLNRSGSRDDFHYHHSVTRPFSPHHYSSSLIQLCLLTLFLQWYGALSMPVWYLIMSWLFCCEVNVELEMVYDICHGQSTMLALMISETCKCTCGTMSFSLLSY